jgi:hypothetical protein
MRSGFPNRGTRTIAVRMAHCAATEIIKARRRTRRSWARCSGLPSTKQPCRVPKSRCGLESGLVSGPGSMDITHLHRKMLRASAEIFATPASCGLLKNRRRPAPRSQGCKVARVLVALDTGMGGKFPGVICLKRRAWPRGRSMLRPTGIGHGIDGLEPKLPTGGQSVRRVVSNY